MPTPPSCRRLGTHCRDLDVTVRISDIEDDGRTLQDAAATWLTGHTQRITWGDPYVEGDFLLVDATIHVACRYLTEDNGGARCQAHGFRGRMPTSHQSSTLPTFQYGGDRFSVIHRGKRHTMELPFETPAPRSLPVLQEENPCDGAPCRTSDNVKGAACCRDLTLELALPQRRTKLEALVRARRSPYLCRVKREDEDTMECEVISACGYLKENSVNCTLHGRVRPTGKPAKPSICSEWPDELEDDETGHPGCVLVG